MVRIETMNGSAEQFAAEHLEHAVVVEVAKRVFVHLDEVSEVLDGLGLVNGHLLAVRHQEVSRVNGLKDAVLVVVKMIQVALVVLVQVHHVVVRAAGEVDSVVESQRRVVAGLDGFPEVELGDFAESVRKTFQVVASQKLADLVDEEFTATVLVQSQFFVLFSTQERVVIQVPVVEVRVEANIWKFLKSIEFF